MNEEKMLALRKDGASVGWIAEAAGVTERRVQTVMRKHGLCRDQRPVHEYRVTVMVPEFVTVSAVSRTQAGQRARMMYNANVRIQCVEEK